MLNSLFKTKVFDIVFEHLGRYPSPLNINYFWGFGLLSGLCLMIQLITGILISMHYTADINLAFESVEHIMRDVNYGWVLRYTHSNGASMFFTVVYLHMARGFFYQSFKKPRDRLWASGVIIFLLLMATGFLGYVLPWGQMSFWGATVITNLFSAIPLIGQDIANWMWGGFSVENPTLKKFYSIHYALPFIILALVFLHLIFLHQQGSSNEVTSIKFSDKIGFYPYFVIKDLFSFLLFSIIFSFFIFFYPNVLAHPDNYIKANPMVTPAHIVPEWYFLPFYAILRSIPDKLGGVICMVGSLVGLFFLPYLIYHPNSSAAYDRVYLKLATFFMFIVLFLGWLGAQPVEDVCIIAGQLATLYYFLFLFSLISFSANINYLVQAGNLLKKIMWWNTPYAFDVYLNGEMHKLVFPWDQNIDYSKVN